MIERLICNQPKYIKLGKLCNQSFLKNNELNLRRFYEEII